MEQDGRKAFNIRLFAAATDGFPSVGTLTLASPFVFCSCVVGVGMIAMGSILTAFFRSGVSKMSDPVLRNLEITGILFLAVGSFFLLSGVGLLFGLCHNYRKAPKTPPVAPPSYPVLDDDPLSLAPKYPPMFIAPSNPYLNPLISSESNHEDITILPGSVMDTEQLVFIPESPILIEENIENSKKEKNS